MRKWMTIAGIVLCLTGCYPAATPHHHQDFNKKQCLIPEGCPIKEKYLK